MGVTRCVTGLTGRDRAQDSPHAHISVPSEELPLASETTSQTWPREFFRGLEDFALVSIQNLRRSRESWMQSSRPRPEEGRGGTTRRLLCPSLPFLSHSSSLSPLCLILCRSILPFSASTSAATAAVVFGRSRKDDGLMRNLEVSRPTGCGCDAFSRVVVSGNAHKMYIRS